MYDRQKYAYDIFIDIFIYMDILCQRRYHMGRKKTKNPRIHKAFTLSKESVEFLKNVENASGLIDALILREAERVAVKTEEKEGPK